MKFGHGSLIKLRFFGIALIFVLGLFAIFGSGPRYAYRVSPPTQTSENEYYDAKISTSCNTGCQSFLLTIVNKTKKELEIDWNKTLYISNGRTSGGFMFEGVVYRDRNNPKPPDIVFANGTFSKTIWPNNLVDFVSGRYGGWKHENLSHGENGVYLTIKVGDEEIHEKLTVNVSREQL